MCFQEHTGGVLDGSQSGTDHVIDQIHIVTAAFQPFGSKLFCCMKGEPDSDPAWMWVVMWLQMWPVNVVVGLSRMSMSQVSGPVAADVAHGCGRVSL